MILLLAQTNHSQPLNDVFLLHSDILTIKSGSPEDEYTKMTCFTDVRIKAKHFKEQQALQNSLVLRGAAAYFIPTKNSGSYL